MKEAAFSCYRNHFCLGRFEAENCRTSSSNSESLESQFNGLLLIKIRSLGSTNCAITKAESDPNIYKARSLNPGMYGNMEDESISNLKGDSPNIILTKHSK